MRQRLGCALRTVTARLSFSAARRYYLASAEFVPVGGGDKMTVLAEGKGRDQALSSLRSRIDAFDRDAALAGIASMRASLSGEWDAELGSLEGYVERVTDHAEGDKVIGAANAEVNGHGPVSDGGRAEGRAAE